MFKFTLRQGHSFKDSVLIREFISESAERIHMDMVIEMEKTMRIPKSYYMRAWYLESHPNVRVYDYGSHTDFFYLIQEDLSDAKESSGA